ncbi:MAG TPA: SNF2-related protein, partial [Luteolibacter sp.]|nr:SNF2-related protein [Luteolibacter sp.]
MSPAPSEDLLRKACGWKAFKQGGELFAAGAVVEAVECEGGWRGAVKAGRKVLRVRVEVRGPSDIEARCGCPVNQASGEICEHAVAVGLALGRPRPMPPEPVAPPVGRPVPCWRVEFMSGWQQAIRRGQLPLRLHPLPRGVAGAFDRWCQGRVEGGRGDDRSPRLIQLRGGDLHEALAHLLEKEELFCAECEDGQALLASGARMVLMDRRLEDGRIEVAPLAGIAVEWIEIGTGFWCLSHHGLRRAGERGLPEELLAPWRRWCRGQGVCFTADEWVLNTEVWRDWIECSAEGWRSGLRFECVRIGIGVDFEGGPQRLLARLRARHGQGGWEPARPDGGPRVLGWVGECCQLADRDAERAAFTVMTGFGFSAPSPGDHSLVLEGEERVAAFLTGKHKHLPADWELGFSAPLQRWLQGRVLVEPVLEAVAADGDRLEFVLSYRSASGERVEAAEIRRCLRGAKVHLGGREVIASDRINQLFDPLLEELEIAQRDGRYEARGAAAELFLKLCKNQDKQLFNNDLQLAENRPIPATISADLRPYQVAGYRWICDRLERFGGALLADDMGLGKTLQTIASVEGLLAPSPASIALVVVPTSLLGNWQREWQRFAASRRLCVLHGAGRDRLRDEVGPGTVVLTSYATLVRDQAWHLRQDYRVVVADEASLMRNPDTDHARALCKLKATARLALTGTPVENGVRDLWSIFRFIQPGWLGTREHFEERYGVKAEGGPDEGVLERLRCLSAPFMLRRLKGQVAADLPPRIVIDELCALSEEQREVYRDLLREGQALVERLRDVGQPAAARMQVLTALL